MNMKVEGVTTGEDELDVEDVIEGEVIEGEPSEEDENLTPDDPSNEDENLTPEDDGSDEVVITIGDEAPPQDDEKTAPTWVKELRKSQRETAKENRELRTKLKALENPQTEARVLPKKPTLSEFDFDADLYDTAMENWYDKKAEIKREKEEKDSIAEEENLAWQKKLTTYNEGKDKLKVKDYDVAEEVFLNSFSQVQQSIVIHGADRPNHVVVAIGTNPTVVAELSKIKDPVKFAFAVAKLEKDLKVKNRKAPPPPEKTVANGTGKSGKVDSALERLRTEAEKTGDYTKVSNYKRKLRNKPK